MEMSIMPASIGRDMRRLVLVPALLMSSGFAFGQASVANVVKKSSDAVVLIVTSDSDGHETALGSGFLISANGEIVTNFHVIKGAHSAEVKLSSGAFFPVSGILASDPDRDLAIIKVNGNNVPLLTLGDTDKLSVGDHVVAIGSPLGLEGTVSDGIVSALREEAQDKRWIQTTAPVSPGNSGGPLLDMRGNVVGVITWRVSSHQAQNLNFAIPSDEVRSLLSKPDRLVPLDSVVADSDQAEQATVKQGASEEQAIEQLRVIAKAIGECPDHVYMSTDEHGYTRGTHIYAPINVVWDIEHRQSYRSPEVGYVEFVQRRYDIPANMKDCKKRDIECNNWNEAEAAADRAVAVEGGSLPLQYRYEFDFGIHGLEFSRALVKTEESDASHWAATSLGTGCEAAAVRAPATPTEKEPTETQTSQDTLAGRLHQAEIQSKCEIKASNAAPSDAQRVLDACMASSK
jgi:Trypsin-like peptidase domain